MEFEFNYIPVKKGRFLKIDDLCGHGITFILTRGRDKIKISPQEVLKLTEEEKYAMTESLIKELKGSFSGFDHTVGCEAHSVITSKIQEVRKYAWQELTRNCSCHKNNVKTKS